MMDGVLSKEVIGVLATLITFFSYLLYFRGIIFFGTIPHAVTWFLWSIFNGIACFGQVLGNGGAGAWPTGAGAIFCFAISLVGVWRGGRDLLPFDIGCLAIALIAIVLWKTSQDPLVAVVIVTIADVVAMIPTIRKAWAHPYQETLGTFSLTALRHALAVIAMSERSLLTVLYPGVLILSNLTFVLLVMYARKLSLQLRPPPPVERA